MIHRIKLGLIFSYDDQWIGGTYYTLNLIQALNVLDESKKPLIKVFSSKIDFNRLQLETKYPYLKFESFHQNQKWLLSRLINKLTYKIFNKVAFQVQYKGSVDILFIMQRSHFLESIPFKKRIYWIPDFQDKYYPEFFSEEGLIQKHNRSEWIANYAENIILSSEAVKCDWEKFYPQFKGKTTVIHFAVTHPEYNSLDINELRFKFKLPEKYFFSPNQFWAHKNHMVVIKAAEILKKMGKPVIIAFSGKENDNRNPGYTEKLKAYVKDNDLDDVVRFLGFLDRREQLQLMKHAIAVIQPSLFEGWSTVIEDAMSMNKLIIASDLKVNQEQLQDKGYYFPIKDHQYLSEIIIQILNKKETVNYNYDSRILKFASTFLNLINNIG